MTRIAFLGLGAMGARMARRLLDAGHDIAVWNRDPQRTRDWLDAAAAAGASSRTRAADSPRSAATDAEVVFSMLTDDAASASVWLDARTGALAGLSPGSIAIECSTVSPAWIRQLAGHLASVGVPLLDAPVAGSRPQAEAGQLILMVGGPAAALQQVQGLLDALGQRTLHVGECGQGAVLKLAVNTLFAAQLASLAEGLGYLQRNGMDLTTAAELLGAFPIVAPPIAHAARLMTLETPPSLFTIDLLAKDLAYIQRTGDDTGTAMPLAHALGKVFENARQQGLGAENFSALARLYR